MIENKKLKLLIEFLKTKKMISLSVLDIKNLTTISDYFVVVVVSTQRELDSLKDNIEDFFAKNNIFCKNVEGAKTKWILLDYSDIVIHLFDKEYNSLYDIKHIWADAEIVDVENETI